MIVCPQFSFKDTAIGKRTYHIHSVSSSLSTRLVVECRYCPSEVGEKILGYPKKIWWTVPGRCKEADPDVLINNKKTALDEDYINSRIEHVRRRY